MPLQIGRARCKCGRVVMSSPDPVLAGELANDLREIRRRAQQISGHDGKTDYAGRRAREISRIAFRWLDAL